MYRSIYVFMYICIYLKILFSGHIYIFTCVFVYEQA